MNDHHENLDRTTKERCAQLGITLVECSDGWLAMFGMHVLATGDDIDKVARDALIAWENMT